ncbi:MAG: hypothetical protein KAQ81_06370 [Deltaproteobacteria bacterium]|nr:hypothetical protein [Deltaproteobacteria bacterium]
MNWPDKGRFFPFYDFKLGRAVAAPDRYTPEVLKERHPPRPFIGPGNIGTSAVRTRLKKADR